MEINLGLIPIIDRGPYDPTHAYRPLDLIHHNDRTYLVRKCCNGIPVSDSSRYAEIHVEVDTDGVLVYYLRAACFSVDSHYEMFAV